MRLNGIADQWEDGLDWVARRCEWQKIKQEPKSWCFLPKIYFGFVVHAARWFVFEAQIDQFTLIAIVKKRYSEGRMMDAECKYKGQTQTMIYFGL